MCPRLSPRGTTRGSGSLSILILGLPSLGEGCVRKTRQRALRAAASKLLGRPVNPTTFVDKPRAPAGLKGSKLEAWLAQQPYIPSEWRRVKTAYKEMRRGW